MLRGHLDVRLTALCLLLVAAAGRMHGAEGPSNPRQQVQIGTPLERSQVPAPLRQGVFLPPQSVSALDISDDGRFIAVGTMGFRHDRNFWLLAADEGAVAWGRYLETWAPLQVAVLPQGKGFAAGLAYGPDTVVTSTVALFRGEKDEAVYAFDKPLPGGRRWFRYGAGDWRTGWPASVPGDSLTRARASVFTLHHLPADTDRGQPGVVWKQDGTDARHPLGPTRPFRLAASADGRTLALGYLVHDLRAVDERTKDRLGLAPPALLSVRDALTSRTLWSVNPMADAPAAPPPPEPAGEFPGLAEDFNLKPLALVPFRVPVSVAVNGDGSRVAVTEYGGRARMGRERILPNWSPRDPVSFCPRQRGTLRVLAAPGKELARAELPQEGLFEAHLDPTGGVVWCVPLAWFARGLAGCPWLPADEQAHTVFVYDLARKAWTTSWRFPDAVSAFAAHPDGSRVLVSCWDGWLYLLNRDGGVRARVRVGGPARLRWSADGHFAVAGTQAGDLCKVDAEGKVVWRTKLPAAELPPLKRLEPVFKEVPVYSVGRMGRLYSAERMGPEQAYVGDMWLIKTPEGGILVDAGGVSGIPSTRQRIQAAGIDPKDIRYVLLSHSHGDHAGAAYLWRAQGAKVVAPASAAFAVTWVMPTWSDYNLWVPCPIDVPLPLKRAGDEAEVTLCGVRLKAIFAPGHSPDSVVYVMDLAGKRVLFTGDIAFDDRRPERPFGSNILHRCWGDVDKALVVMRVIRDKVLPLQPDFDFKGHASHADASALWERILQASRDDLRGRKEGGKDR